MPRAQNHIMFSTENVEKIFQGAKTQTRRVAKPQPTINEFEPQLLHFMRGMRSFTFDKNNPKRACPYGIPGDRLWVKEYCWIDRKPCIEAGRRAFFPGDDVRCEKLTVTGKAPFTATVEYLDSNSALKKRIPMLMPRWASRLTVEIVSVHIERLWEITESGAQAEGIDLKGFRSQTLGIAGSEHRIEFSKHWDELNKERGHGWETNPWVWVLTLKRVKA